MEYKKINNENFDIHLINSNRFKTSNIVIFFSKKYNRKENALSSLLIKNMVYTSKKYNTKNKMAIAGENLYGARVSSSFNVIGNVQSIVFSLDYLNHKYTDKSYLKKSLEFLYEILFNPNVENNGFKEEYFNIIKNDTISSFKSIKDNPNLFASIEYNKLMYKGTPSEYGTLPTLKDIENVTPENLFEYYKKLFTDYRIDVVVNSDIDDEKELVSVINEVFSKFRSTKEEFDLIINHKYSEEVITKKDTLEFNQSKLYMGFRLDNMDYHEINHVLKLYNTILGTMNDSILFNIVREKNSLCYSIGSYFSRFNPSLTIHAGINKVNYEKSVELIKECMELMKDKKSLERLFESAKKTLNTFLNNYYDDVTSQVNRYYYGQFYDCEDIEEHRENINKVTIDEIIKINNKIHLNTIYLLEGDNNGKKDI